MYFILAFWLTDILIYKYVPRNNKTIIIFIHIQHTFVLILQISLKTNVYGLLLYQKYKTMCFLWTMHKQTNNFFLIFLLFVLIFIFPFRVHQICANRIHPSRLSSAHLKWLHIWRSESDRCERIKNMVAMHKFTKKWTKQTSSLQYVPFNQSYKWLRNDSERRRCSSAWSKYLNITHSIVNRIFVLNWNTWLKS